MAGDERPARDHRTETAVRFAGAFFLVGAALGAPLIWLGGSRSASRWVMDGTLIGLTLWAAIELLLVHGRGRIVGTIVLAVRGLRLLVLVGVGQAAATWSNLIATAVPLAVYTSIAVVLWLPRTSAAFTSRRRGGHTEGVRFQFDWRAGLAAACTLWLAYALTVPLLRALPGGP
jgi:hypothetical protein